MCKYGPMKLYEKLSHVSVGIMWAT